MSVTLGSRWGRGVSSCYGRATTASHRIAHVGEAGAGIGRVEPVDEAADELLATAAPGGGPGCRGARLDACGARFPRRDDVLLRHPVAPADGGGAGHPHR